MSKNKYLLSSLDSDFAKLPNAIGRLGPLLSKQERRIYPYATGVYLICAGSAEGFHPGVRHLKSNLGYCKDTITKAFAFLVKKGILVKLSEKGRNVYGFVAVEDWKVSWPAGHSNSVNCPGPQDGASDTTGHNNKKNNKKPREKNSQQGNPGKTPSIFGSDKNDQTVNEDPYQDLPEIRPDPNIAPPTHVACSLEDIFSIVGLGKTGATHE